MFLNINDFANNDILYENQNIKNPFLKEREFFILRHLFYIWLASFITVNMTGEYNEEMISAIIGFIELIDQSIIFSIDDFIEIELSNVNSCEKVILSEVDLNKGEDHFYNNISNDKNTIDLDNNINNNKK